MESVMMLYPPMASLVDKVGSRYLLVNLVARRARQIANNAEENGEILDKKPVSMAMIGVPALSDASTGGHISRYLLAIEIASVFLSH